MVRLPPAAARIGISGWTYAPWRGSFFPAGLRQKGELAYASRQVNSIEINGTFYSLQRPTSFALWHDETPADFVFSVKCPRFITHLRRLKDVEIPLANFLASGVLRLEEKLGPLLWQLPPSLPFDPARLEAFLRLLPPTTKAAALLARRHDGHVRHGTWLTVEHDRPLRHALEIRHPSYAVPAFIELLRRHGIALVVADTANKWPALEDVTAGFVYVRLHGQSELYVSGYTDAALAAWAAKVKAWLAGRSPAGPQRIARAAPRLAGRDVFVYFDNDVKTHAPFDAMSLARRIGLRVPEGAAHPPVESTEEARMGWPAVRRKRPAPARA